MLQTKYVITGIIALLLAHLILHTMLSIKIAAFESKKSLYLNKLNRTNNAISDLSNYIDVLQRKKRLTSKLQLDTTKNIKFTISPPSNKEKNKISKRNIETKKHVDDTVNKPTQKTIHKYSNLLLYTYELRDEVCFSKIHCLNNLKLSAVLADNYSITNANFRFDYIDKYKKRTINLHFNIESKVLQGNNIALLFNEIVVNPSDPSDFSPLMNKPDRTVKFIGSISDNNMSGTLSWKELSDDGTKYIPMSFNIILSPQILPVFDRNKVSL